VRLNLRAIAIVVALAGACGGRAEGPGPAYGVSTVSTASGSSSSQSSRPPTPAPVASAFDLILDPVARDLDWHPASEQLRGKRAIVVALTTYDSASLIQLRELEPLLRALPADVQCLLVAMQPLSERPIVEAYFDKAFDASSGRPCLRAIGDPTRARLGALAALTTVPTTIVLRADGSAVGAAAGLAPIGDVRAALERAR
jgi:hypothetical protein